MKIGRAPKPDATEALQQVADRLGIGFYNGRTAAAQMGLAVPTRHPETENPGVRRRGVEPGALGFIDQW